MVATPIEQQVNGVEGMLYMSSTSSSAGVYRLTVTFEIGTDLDMATVLVQNRVNMTLSSLPQEVTKIGVTTTKESTNVVMFLSLTSDNPSYDALYLSNYAELNLVNELSRVKGVGSVGEFGAGNYSMRLWLNPDLLTIRGISPQEIISAIESQNIQVAPGAVGAPPPALLAGSAAAIAPEEAFPAVNTYPGFADVAGSAWYAATVQTCYEVGLMTGTGAGFAPDQVLTVGEVVAIAARMNEAITGDSIYLVDSTLPWYASYVDYLEKLGVEVPAPVKQATRQEFITMLAAVVPEDMLTPINQITALPDTADAAVLSFYNAGILTGVDDWGTFAPDKTLTRAETAAMVARVARPEPRESFTPADYAMFTAAYLKPADVLFTNGVTAGQYLPYVQTLIDGLEADCAAQGMEFNWFNTVDGVIFLDYVEDTALAHFGVTAKDGTQLSDAAQAFLDFAMSADAASLIAQAGAVPPAK